MADLEKSSNIHPIDRFVGRQLRDKRLVLNLTQNKIGEELGITFQQIQKYESGCNRISASRLYEFAAISGTSIDSFFPSLTELEAKSESAQKIPRSQIDRQINSETEAVLRLFSQIKNPKIRTQLLKLLKSVAEDES